MIVGNTDINGKLSITNDRLYAVSFSPIIYSPSSNKLIFVDSIESENTITIVIYNIDGSLYKNQYFNKNAFIIGSRS